MPSILGTILANIPWGQVVESAPKIAQGAGRLWETVKNRRTEPPASTPGSSPATTDEAPTGAQLLDARVAALQAQVQDLQDEMRASAQLVRDLAEQNAMLVEQLQATQQRQARLATLGGVCLAVLAGAVLLQAWLR